jgi:hypothetical protein
MKSRVLWLEGILFLACLFSALDLQGQPSAEPSDIFWQPDGPVYAILATKRTRPFRWGLFVCRTSHWRRRSLGCHHRPKRQRISDGAHGER